jgi:hypothetical protein
VCEADSSLLLLLLPLKMSMMWLGHCSIAEHSFKKTWLPYCCCCSCSRGICCCCWTGLQSPD